MSITETQPDRSCASDPVRYLTEDGDLIPGAGPPPLSDGELVELYEDLRLARHFDERALSIQRQGRIATYAPMRGQEGAQVASAWALDEEDWLYPTYRDNAAKIVRGVDPADILTTLRGVGEGYRVREDVRVMPEYIPIATQIPHATGAAWASKLGDEGYAALAYFGDGATSEGDFHEGLNFAGVYDVPAVFFCNNNQWAISTPFDRQTASETIAQKASAYGFEGIRVDGMDPLAVYDVTRHAVETAKDPGDGLRPTLVEALQYRLSAHTSSDDPSRYREGVPEEWERKDPLRRMGSFLRGRGLLDDETDAAIEARVKERVSDAIDRAEAAEADPDEMFEHVYEEPTPELEAQSAELDRLREAYGDAALTGDHP
jgi:pyruvate dehydrogenase E1 component alpha subunit